MLDSAGLVAALGAAGVDFYCGVPDSVLAAFCAAVEQHLPSAAHVIAPNEGQAVALAAGHFLATGHPALVYLQNSGLGNALHPLLSLADQGVFGLPMVLLVGWRGEPGGPDAPQHLPQGRATLPLLAACGIPVEVLAAEQDAAEAALRHAVTAAHRRAGPVAVLVPRGVLASPQRRADVAGIWLRGAALEALLARLAPETALVATTGFTARELWLLRRADQGAFPMVGSMGHAASLALGIALGCPPRRVCCIDGDAALLMQLGGLAMIGDCAPPNLLHVVLNNGAHDSVGGAPSAGLTVDFPALARACGYRQAARADSASALATIWPQLHEGPSLLELRIGCGVPAGLGRPDRPLQACAHDFSRFLTGASRAGVAGEDATAPTADARATPQA